MDTQTLQDRIDQAFQRYHVEDSYLYKDYVELAKENNLLYFFIHDYQWFKGADEIVDLVSEMHSNETPYNIAVAAAEEAGCPIYDEAHKMEMINNIKMLDEWRDYFVRVMKINQDEIVLPDIDMDEMPPEEVYYWPSYYKAMKRNLAIMN